MADPAIVIRLEGAGSTPAAGPVPSSAPQQAGAPAGQASGSGELGGTNRDLDQAHSTLIKIASLMNRVGQALGMSVGKLSQGMGIAAEIGNLYKQLFPKRAGDSERAKQYGMTAGEAQQAAQGVPTVRPPGFGDQMAGMPRGNATAIGKDGIPIVRPASHTEMLDAPGTVPKGTPVESNAGEAGLLSIPVVGAAIAVAMNTYAGGKKAVKGYNDSTEIVSGLAQTGMGPILGPMVANIIDGVTEAVGNVMRSPGVIAERGAGIIAAGASGNNAQAVGMTYDAMVDLAEVVPLVGHQLGMVGETAGKVVRAFGTVVEAFVSRGRELSGYSGGLAASYAVSDVRRLMADINEAQRLDSAGLSRLNDASTDLEMLLREMLLPIKELIVGYLADAMEYLVKVAESIPDWWNQFMDFSEKSLSPIINLLQMQLEYFQKGSRVFFDKEFWEMLKKSHFDALRMAKVEEKEPVGVWDWLNMPADQGPLLGKMDPAFINPGLPLPILKRFGR